MTLGHGRAGERRRMVTQRLRERRRQLGLTQKQVVSRLAKLGVLTTNKALSSLEHGAGLDVAKLPDLARALECTVTYLLGLTADPCRWEPDSPGAEPGMSGAPGERGVSERGIPVEPGVPERRQPVQPGAMGRGVPPERGMTPARGLPPEHGMVPGRGLRPQHGVPTGRQVPAGRGIPAERGIPDRQARPAQQVRPADRGIPVDHGPPTERGTPTDGGGAQSPGSTFPTQP